MFVAPAKRRSGHANRSAANHHTQPTTQQRPSSKWSSNDDGTATNANAQQYDASATLAVSEAQLRVAAAERLLADGLAGGTEFALVECAEGALALLAGASEWFERAA